MKLSRNNFAYRVWASFLTKFGDVMIRTDQPRVTAKEIRLLTAYAQPGDVLCRAYDCYLDSFFIKGEFTHSGIVIGDSVVHAVAEGVEAIDIIDFVKNCDNFVLLRPEKPNIKKMTAYIRDNIGKPYDFFFDNKEVDHFYCHEFSYKTQVASDVKLPFEKGTIYAEFFINNMKTIYKAFGV